MMRYLFIGVCLMHWGCNSDSHSSLSREVMVIPYLVSPIITDIPFNEANLIFSKVAGVDKYQIQVAKTKDEFSSKTGFKKHILHNKIITTNRLDIKLPKHIKEIYWSVRCIVDKDSFAYMPPIQSPVSQLAKVMDQLNSSLKKGQLESLNELKLVNQLKVSLLKVKMDERRNQVRITYNLSNEGKKCDAQFHYFASDVDQFTQTALLLPMSKRLHPETNEKISIRDVIPLKSLNLKGKTLLIVPSIQGEFSSKVIAHEIIR